MTQAQMIARCLMAATASLTVAGTLVAQSPAPGSASTPTPFVVPAWAFPGNGGAPTPPPMADSVALLSVPGSAARYTEAQTRNPLAPPDWHPEGHPPMPHIIAHGRPPAGYACGFCHLPNGRGRPENATVAGLPAAYITQQVQDMRSGARRSAGPAGYRPWELMHAVAMQVSDADLAEAAAYFASIRMVRRVTVTEAERIPASREVGFLHRLDPDRGTEPLGQRIVETPLDVRRHELRDDASGFMAYVPPGSLARGAELATRGIDGPASACTTCHGPDLRGVGLIPPIAGRSAMYLMRQLVAFKTGARAGAAGQPMAIMAAKLSTDDMIAAAAYAASREP